ncbi:MAG: diguanylate cyclase [Thermodesulfovibrionales bacterium]|nr:diguanylate cyclase [Thermodesulfovibrionales bacterium]
MKILVAEDDPVSLKILESILTDSGYEVILAKNGKEALDVLSLNNSPKLAILDWLMPEMDGIEVCKAIRQLNKEPYIYIILLTVKNDIKDIITGLESGADDYILKPFNPDELKVRLRVGQRIINLHEELIATREVLRDLAARDSLTGAWNRITIWEMLEMEINRSKRVREHLGIIMSDIDHFKLINDKYGHITGDIVLREVVKRIKGSLRIYSGVGRYGGEEFLIILPGCNIDNTFKIAERIRKIIESFPIETPKGLIKVTMSFGISSMSPQEELSAITLVNSADEALYIAKQKGRNRVEKARPIKN